MKGSFKLKKGDLLKIIIGQEGSHNTISGGAGGGGGTFVVREDNSPLIVGKTWFNQQSLLVDLCQSFLVAGGGGGVDKMKTESPRCHGSINQEGNPGYGGSMLSGGSGGRGAEDGDNGYSGGGGGGLKTSGRSNKNFGGSKGTGGEGGKSFTTGKFSAGAQRWFHCFNEYRQVQYEPIIIHYFIQSQEPLVVDPIKIISMVDLVAEEDQMVPVGEVVVVEDTQGVLVDPVLIPAVEVVVRSILVVIN